MAERSAAVLAAVALLLLNVPLLLGSGEPVGGALELAQGGPWWGAVTWHFVHFTREHALLDAGAFLLLLPLAGLRAGGRAILLAIPAGTLAALASDVAAARGASGLDSALLTCVACGLLREGSRSGRALGLAGLAALAAKVAFEWSSGSAAFCQTAAFVPLPLVHLACGAAGACAHAGRLMRGSRPHPHAIAGRRSGLMLSRCSDPSPSSQRSSP